MGEGTLKIKSLLLGLTLALLLGACRNDQAIPDEVTFTEHVAPILYQNCSICHRQGGAAHFSLVTFAEAKKNAGAIAYVTREKLMPPWPADPHYTEFKGQRLLTDRDISVLAKWVKDGLAEGPQDKLPKLPAYPSGSLVGQPGISIAVPPVYLPANSADQFLIIKVPFELPADTFASLIEFATGPRNAVHHVNGDMVKYEFNKKKNVFEGSRIAPMTESKDSIVRAFEQLGLPNDDGSYPTLQKSVVNFLPGADGQLYPPGIGGYFIPRKGAFILNGIHYGFNNKGGMTDSSHINIFFTKTPPKRPIQEFQLGTLGVAPVEPDMLIQPDSIKHVWSRFTIPKDISVLTVNPHMHLLGKSFKAYALKPNGDTIRLIYIPRWDFNWQYFYTFKKMVKVPAGSIMVAEGVYDNTRQNLNNPFSPPRLVTDQNGSMRATDEMFQFIVSYLPYEEGDEQRSLE